MREDELKERWRKMALRILRVADALPRTYMGDVLGKQVVRSATSVAANYRAACKARSRAEFLSKLGIVEEEADETALWISLIGDSNLVPPERLADLASEVDQIISIIAASRKTTRRNSS